MGSKCWREACVVGCTRWGLARTWRCWAELKESSRAFESDWDGGGGRSSIGDGGARMRRGRGVTEAGGGGGGGGEKVRVTRGWDGNLWGEEERLERKGRMGCYRLDGGRGRRAAGKSGIKMGQAARRGRWMSS